MGQDGLQLRRRFDRMKLVRTPSCVNLGEISACGLVARQVVVWQVDILRWRSAELIPVLGQDERARAAQFASAKHRDRYVIRRGVLQLILAAYPDFDHLRLRRETCTDCGADHERPFLVDRHGETSVFVSTSSADDVCTVALSRAGPVGVDIVSSRRAADLLNARSRFLTRPEVQYLDGCSSNAARVAVVEFWAIKEAYLKAIGTGLRTDPRTVDALGLLHGQELTAHSAQPPASWACHLRRDVDSITAVVTRRVPALLRWCRLPETPASRLRSKHRQDVVDVAAALHTGPSG